jgi:hypothetical protein
MSCSSFGALRSLKRRRRPPDHRCVPRVIHAREGGCLLKYTLNSLAVRTLARHRHRARGKTDQTLRTYSRAPPRVARGSTVNSTCMAAHPLNSPSGDRRYQRASPGTRRTVRSRKPPMPAFESRACARWCDRSTDVAPEVGRDVGEFDAEGALQPAAPFMRAPPRGVSCRLESEEDRAATRAKSSVRYRIE